MSSEWWMVVAIGCGFLLFGTWAVVVCAGPRESSELRNWWLASLVAGLILVRLALAMTTKGYVPDIATFSAWVAHATDGLASFYADGYGADYPPGYIYVLWLIAKLRQVLGLGFDSPSYLVALKLPAILADAVSVYVLYRLAQQHWSDKAALAIAGLYAFNPAVIIDSAVWGQVDAVLTLFILLGALCLEKRPAASAACFAIALLVKPQALIFAPLPLFWFADRLLRQTPRATTDLSIFIGAAVATFCLGILPFTLNQSPVWIVAKYGNTLASYPFATVNAFNFFALNGANFVPITERFLFLSYELWGYAFITLILIFAGLTALKGRKSSRFWYLAAFLSVSVFVLSVKMHERYLFPALALTLAFAIVSHARWGLYLFAGLSATQLLNVVEVLAFSEHKIYAVPSHDPLLLAGSLANVLLLLGLVLAGYWRYVKRAPLCTAEQVP